MQQAARVSDETGFFNLEGTGKPGQLVEMNATRKIFSQPRARRRPRTTSPAASAETGPGRIPWSLGIAARDRPASAIVTG